MARTPGDPGAGHARARLLSEVNTGGPLVLLQVLRRAAAGDEIAARTEVSALLRALPAVGSFTAHELLRAAGIRENQLVGELDPGQFGALVRTLDHLARFMGLSA